jgi:hypothetical protein
VPNYLIFETNDGSGRERNSFAYPATRRRHFAAKIGGGENYRAI